MRISIVIPCYNTEKYLREAIESVLGQTRAADEIIVVDDGSTDGSAALANSFGPPVQVVSQENRGLAGARNSGLQQATGDYVLFLDADDLLDEKALEVLCDHVQDNFGVVAVMNCALFENDPATPYHIRVVQTDEFFPRIIRGNIAPVHCWFVPRQLVIDIGGFDTKLKIFEDWECWCRVALHGAKLMRVPFVGALYRRHAESMMAKQIHSVSDNVVLGHLHALGTLCTGMLARPDLLHDYGETLFWSTWTGIRRARGKGISSDEVNGLRKELETLARVGPACVTKTRFAMLIRVFGFPVADMFRGILTRTSANTKATDADRQKPSWLLAKNQPD